MEAPKIKSLLTLIEDCIIMDEKPNNKVVTAVTAEDQKVERIPPQFQQQPVGADNQ